jgi:methyltransferase (TIGR00027 family)
VAEQADWDIVNGVGLTALGAAATRAIESCRLVPLVNDPYAAAFVRAAASQLPSPMPATLEEADLDQSFPWRAVATYSGVRSKFFDSFYGAAAKAGIRQVVILAAGLDSRAFRLDWPSGTRVYEVDAPLVIAFKDRVLGGMSATPRCERRPVTCDLREDWQSALRQTGFDPDLPTAWLAEGLLPYLRDDARQTLLASANELSAPGSRLAVDHMDPAMAEMARDPAINAAATRLNLDFAAIVTAASEHNPATWLHRHGWSVTVKTASEVGEAYGRPLDDVPVESLKTSLLINAEKN